MFKIIRTPLGNYLKLSKNQSSKMTEDKEEMVKVPYTLVVGTLIYAMVCTRPNISHVVGVMSRFISYMGKEH